VVLIFPDQLGATWLGCYGHPDVRTPNVDRFAREGTTFERAYTASPICTPFRGTLFTGRYPCQTGITENGFRLPHAETTLAELFNRGGYHTAYVGKWHLSGPPGGNRWVPPEERAGFQTFLGWESHHVDHWSGRIWADDPDRAIPMPGHETDALTEIACDTLSKLERPFCLFVAYQAPHPPCTPPPDTLALYEHKELTYRANVTDRKLWYRRPAWGCDYNLRTFLDRHYGEISHFDSAFGRLLSKVAELGLADNTIVLLTSDHGEMAGCHGLYGKGVMYEEAVRIPLIVRHPAGPSGARSSALFSSVDFMPTLLDLCGLTPAPAAEGVSYGPLIRGKEQTTRETVTIQYHDLCLRRGAYKLVTDATAHVPTALHHLETDPYEQDNVVHDLTYRQIVQRMQRELSAWLQDVLSRAGKPQGASQPSPALKD
jgi:arylsulfatase A-like enzyme